MSVLLESAVLMGKKYSDNWHSIKNTKDLTMKRMFDISAKLVSEQDEIYGVKTIDWKNYSWKYLSLIGDEQVIILQRTKVYVFSDSVLCLGKIHENLQSNAAWEQRLGWIKSSQNYRNLDRIDCDPMEFEWNIFQDSIERTERPVIIDRSQKSQGKINALNDIDCVPSNVQLSHQEALLYVFEAVIKMIIKGRSPTMRHVSRNPQSCA